MLFEHVTETEVESPGSKTGNQTPPESQWRSPGLDLLF
jgi:hypothetical protein